jgi:hypothetical protein
MWPCGPTDIQVGDAVPLRGEVTRISKNASGGWEVTVQVDGFSQSRLTLSAEHVEKVET